MKWLIAWLTVSWVVVPIWASVCSRLRAAEWISRRLQIAPVPHHSFTPIPELAGASQVYASAILAAYCRNDALQVRDIAAEVFSACESEANSASESERLDLLGGIALALLRSKSSRRSEEFASYLKLLRHLAHRDPPAEARVPALNSNKKSFSLIRIHDRSRNFASRLISQTTR